MFENVNNEYFEDKASGSVVRIHSGVSANPMSDKQRINSYSMSWAASGGIGPVEQVNRTEAEILMEIKKVCDMRLAEIAE